MRTACTGMDRPVGNDCGADRRDRAGRDTFVTKTDAVGPCRPDGAVEANWSAHDPGSGPAQIDWWRVPRVTGGAVGRGVPSALCDQGGPADGQNG
jgi:hypothetical protein